MPYQESDEQANTSEQDVNMPSGEISLSLREHNIVWTLPFGAKMEGKLLLPGGALIYGDFVGDIFCESGSVIVKKGGRFQGMAEADMIYVEGDISSADQRHRSVLIARKMIAASSTARINGDIFSKTYALHKAKVWGALRTLEEGAPYRKSNKAVGIGATTNGSTGSSQAKNTTPALKR